MFFSWSAYTYLLQLFEKTGVYHHIKFKENMMIKRPALRVMIIAFLLATFLIGSVSSVAAFDGRGGDTVQIASDETINDNLYIGAQTFTLDGTVNGDVFAAGNTIMINGTVQGDVLAAGQTIILNGTVNGDVRIAGGALYLGEKANVSGEVVAFGGSLETRKDSQVVKDLAFFGGQVLLAGNIQRNVKVSTGGMKILGNIDGNVDVEVGSAEEAGPGPSVYMPKSSVVLPNVAPGLSIDSSAKIGGKLVYTSSKEMSLPANVAANGIQHNLPVVKPEKVVKTPTFVEQTMAVLFDLLRRIATLIFFGLMIGWLFPAFLTNAIEPIQRNPLSALGWGIVSWAAFLFSVLVLIVAMVVGAVIFGVLSLGSVSGVIIWLGLLLLLALITGFILIITFLAQIIVSTLGGKLILARIKPEWSEHKLWPLFVGVVVFALIGSVPVVGWLINLFAVLFGLGALWILGRFAIRPQTQPVL
jgi:cytoskeletal protein CcmA (bactofilin family)